MRNKGYTLVELTIVTVVLGIVLAAVYLFFLSNSGTVESAASENISATGNRLTVDAIETHLGNAGCVGEASPSQWHPVIEAGEDRLTFVENTDRPETLGPEDTLTISADPQGIVTVADASGNVLGRGAEPSNISFTYTDSRGEELDRESLSTAAGRDRIRTISYTVGVAGDQGAVLSRTVSPQNLGIPVYERTPDFTSTERPAGGGTDYVSFFYENWESGGAFNTEDYIEADWVWHPFIEEDFESAASWQNNWTKYSSEPAGRVLRSSSYPYDGSYSLLMDRSPYGTYNQNAAIWTIDLSEYDEYADEVRLHFFMREFSDEDDGDGVFFPDFLGGVNNELISEDFSGYTDGPKDNWEYWSDTYGNIVVDDLWSYPSGGNYLNLDSRRTGSMSRNRVLWKEDLSAYSSSTDLELRFSYCSRGDEEQSGPAYLSDFVGLAGADGITGVPVVYQNLDTDADGAWMDVVLDLDSMVPAGYDWSQFSIMFGQSDDGRTISSNSNDGISFDNVGVFEYTAADTQFNDKIYDPPSSIPTWDEVAIDLDDAAVSFGRPFDSNFTIAFCQYDNYPVTSDGLVYDEIALEEEEWGIPGWKHGTWDGYSVDEWEPSNHDHYHASSGPSDQEWCWSVAGTGDYSSGVTQAYIESPEIDLTSYPAGERLSLAFFHYYDWASGDGGNVKIWSDATGSWELAVPYWGYYTASISALDNEPGWDGSKSDWNFCVIDITEYAGQTIKARFNYGTTGSATAGGWNVDYFRVRQGPDWPQIIWYGWPDQEYADWFGWSYPPGVYDPGYTPRWKPFRRQRYGQFRHMGYKVREQLP